MPPARRRSPAVSGPACRGSRQARRCRRPPAGSGRAVSGHRWRWLRPGVTRRCGGGSRRPGGYRRASWRRSEVPTGTPVPRRRPGRGAGRRSVRGTDSLEHSRTWSDRTATDLRCVARGCWLRTGSGTGANRHGTPWSESVTPREDRQLARSCPTKPRTAGIRSSSTESSPTTSSEVIVPPSQAMTGYRSSSTRGS